LYFCGVEQIISFLHHWLGPDLKVAGFIILNLIVIESLLSVDNAAVLARMVIDLPPKDRKLALRVGIILAYIFRGGCLIFAEELIRINWLKLLGGGYLLYLFFDFFYKKIKPNIDEENKAIPQAKFIFINPFITTVLMVELMDLSFSIDNVFAAVAFTSNIVLVCIGVFIGIIAMRIVAGYFVTLMERFPFLEAIAIIVIGLLGVKLCLSFLAPYIGGRFEHIINDHHSDLYFSLITVSIFALPILSSLLLGFPKRGAN
jgi:YkoY family integral membrane protein